jgi:alkanesulfonate monooxygenase SsuD/methylene tetrahydromethanopterin reductase-like flavin-dependent oxidoreductase (luciferase family)
MLLNSFLNTGPPPARRKRCPILARRHTNLNHTDRRLVGSPEEVVEKILYDHELFGNERFMAQIGVGALPHEKVMRAIELFGTEVAPAVRKELAPRPAANA